MAAQVEQDEKRLQADLKKWQYALDRLHQELAHWKRKCGHLEREAQPVEAALLALETHPAEDCHELQAEMACLE